MTRGETLRARPRGRIPGPTAPPPRRFVRAPALALVALAIVLLWIPMTTGLSITEELFDTAVTVDRIASTGAALPPIDDGRLFFTILEFFENGRVEGTVDIVFENGRTLSGSFMGSLQLIDLS